MYSVIFQLGGGQTPWSPPLPQARHWLCGIALDTKYNINIHKHKIKCKFDCYIIILYYIVIQKLTNVRLYLIDI